MSWLKAGALYFALTFLVGFLIGPLRELVLKPRLGGTGALLIEAPVMLVAMFYVAWRCVGWFAVSPRAADRIAMGGVALALLLCAEVVLSKLLRGMTLDTWLAHFASTEGMISAALYATFAAAPLLLLAAAKEPGR